MKHPKPDLRERDTFFQSKYNNYRQLMESTILLASIIMAAFFIADCLAAGGFERKTFPARMLPLALSLIYLVISRRKKSWRLMVPLSYVLLHALMWCMIWVLWENGDQSHASEDFLLLQLVFLAVGLGAPFALSAPFHLLFLEDIILSNLFFHYKGLDTMLVLSIAGVVGVCVIQLFMQYAFRSYYRAQRELANQSVKDPLTGAYNRNYLSQIVEAGSHRLISAFTMPVSVFMVDIDFFKKVNDRFGHAQGDRVLAYTAERIRAALPNATVIRWGGEEFAIFLPETALEEAVKKAEDLRTAVETGDCGICSVTVSVGVAAYQQDYQKAIDCADSAMYRAKTAGRNRVQVYNGRLFQNTTEGALDRTGLDNRTFEAFSATSPTRYLYMTNMKTGVSRWSKSAVEYFGLPGEYFLNAGEIWGEMFVHPEDRPRYTEDIQAVLSGARKFHDVDYRARNRKGEYVYVSCRGVILKGDETTPDLFAGTMENHGIVTGLDHLTGLYNTYELSNELTSALQRRESGCLLMIGISGFGRINEIYGFTVGDQALRIFSDRLKRMEEPFNLVFRSDGAKFAFILPNMEESELRTFYARLQHIAEHEIRVSSTHVAFSISGGVVRFEDPENREGYYRSLALSAMRSSKKEHFGQLVFFGEEDSQNETLRLHMLEAIGQSASCTCEGFYLLYQPILEPVSGRITGAEALLRWRSDTFGDVSPASFIAWLENEASFPQVRKWILRTALSDLRDIVAANPVFTLNVNLAYKQIAHPGFRDTVMDILQDTGFPPQNLCLEITERCIQMDTDFLRGIIDFLQNQKIRVALDDFGTGGSSSSLLLSLPVDEVKLDHSFVENILTDPRSHALVDSIVACADALNTLVCIEGVETPELRYALIESYPKALHQGFLYSPPITKEELSKRL